MPSFKRTLTPQKVLKYALLISVAWICYRIYVSLTAPNEASRFQGYGPRDIGQGRHHGDKQKRQSLKHDPKSDQGQETSNHKDKQEHNKLGKKGGKALNDENPSEENSHPKQDVEDSKVEHAQKEEETEKTFKASWELEQDLQVRRKQYYEAVAKRAEEFEASSFKDMHEADDHLAFMTVATPSSSWAALTQFIYSKQYFYPHSDIAIYDLGLSQEHNDQLSQYCRVQVLPTYVPLWPKHLQNVESPLWKPLVWQMGLAHFGHVIYIEPDRYLSQKNMKDYIQHSRRHGITFVGPKLQYSPYVVTHPEMYYFLQADTRKVQRTNMFDITMAIMHNAAPVRHEFMRHLISCILEEYCVSPPGATRRCDSHRVYPGAKKYAGCHRYELSAVNILMNNWFQYKQEEYLVKDIATAHVTGKDFTNKLQVCADQQDAKQEM